MIYVTHEQVDAMSLGQRRRAAERGQLQQIAPAAAVVPPAG